jgi:hypothetical protein
MDTQHAFLQISNRKLNRQNDDNWNVLARSGSGCKQSTGLQAALKVAELFDLVSNNQFVNKWGECVLTKSTQRILKRLMCAGRFSI